MSNQVQDQRSELTFPQNVNAPATVAILLCTFNGAPFLGEQLDSFEAQSFTAWTLYVSDDGSTDATRQILIEYQKRWGAERLVTFDGPRKGFAQNFLSLVRRPEIQADYFAFSDQDDIWFADKLSRGIEALTSTATHKPAMFCTRTRLVDEAGQVIGYSPVFTRPPSFQNALVQSIAGANTMLINDAARRILADVPLDASIIAHDWLTYLLVSGCGGVTTYDPQPSLDYRQHRNNLIGSNSSWRDRFNRLGNVFSGLRKTWTDSNLSILDRINAPLSPESQATLLHFRHARIFKLPERLQEMKKAGVYRQTLAGNLSLFIAACLGKV